MSLDLIYESMIMSKKCIDKTPVVNLFEKIEKIETEFKIKHVHIYIKSSDSQPRHAYGGPVVNYQERDGITIIDAIDKQNTTSGSDNKKIIIKIDTKDAVDVTIIDQHNNIEDEFNVNGMQFTDFDDPSKLSIIKVEEV